MFRSTPSTRGSSPSQSRRSLRIASAWRVGGGSVAASASTPSTRPPGRHGRSWTPSPHRKANVLVLDRLDVEAWGGRATRRSGGRGQGGATPSVSAAAAENPLARPGENRTARSEARRFRGRAGRTDRRDGRDDLAELELVEDGRLTWRSARDMGRVSEDTRGCLEAERREENGSRVRAHAPAPSRPTMRRRRCRRAQAEECHVGGFKIWGLSLIEQGPIRDPSRERTSRDGEG